MTNANREDPTLIDQETYENSAKARRVLNVDSSGNEYTEDNPIPVTSVTHISTDLEGKGFVTVGTSAIELTFTGSTESIIIQADDDNTGIIYIGKSNVTNLGANSIVKLQPGWSIEMDYEDSTNALYAVSDTASQKVIAGALK